MSDDRIKKPDAAMSANSARTILDNLYEYDTEQRPFQVQLAIAEALTAIAQAMTAVPEPTAEQIGEEQVEETIRRVREDGNFSGPFLGWFRR